VFLFILAIQLVFSPLIAASTSRVVLDLSQHALVQSEQLEQLLPEKFLLGKLDISTDSALDTAELRALINLPESMPALRESVAHALFCLAKKQKFKQVTISATLADGAVQLIFALETEWTLAHLSMRGTLIGKDRYRHHYLIAPGEPFDEKHHQSSIEKIQQALAAEGYFNAVLTDTLSYDETTKTVSVTIHIAHKKQFVIRDLCVQLQTQEGISVKEGDLVYDRTVKLVRGAFQMNSYSKELLDRGAKQLHEYLVKIGFFTNTITLEEEINRGQSSVRLLLQVTLHHKNIFEFRGNRFFSVDQLLEQIKLFGKSVTLIPPSLIAEEFIELYKKEGFWHAEITWQDDGERILFSITEGKRIGISDIVIKGACALSEKDLIKKYGKPLLSARYFNGDRLKQMLDALGQAYLQQGFWDFAVIDYEYLPLTNNHYRIIVTVHEGAQRLLTGVSLELGVGQACMKFPCIKKYAQLPAPIPFDIQIIQKHKQAITKSLQASGHLYARPQPELVEEEQGTRLVWKLMGSTDVVTFGDTIIIGNSALPSHIISRELLYEKGAVWDQRKIEKSVARLKKMGIFDSVTLAPDDLATTELSKTLLLKYVEDFPYEVRARLGIQGVNRNIVQFNAEGISYKAGGSFLAKNPLNRGDCFRFDLDFSRYMYDIVASYKFPWLWNWPIRTEIKGYSSHYDQPFVIGSAKVLYKALQDGFLFGFSKEYSLGDADLNIGCEWLEIKPGDGCGNKKEQLARAMFLNPRLIDHAYPYLFIQPTLFSSSLDNKIQPTRGALSLVSCKAMLAPTFSRAAFFKLLLEQSFFVPWGPFVFAWRGRCGTIFNSNFQNINPIERFYLGGAYSVRSYEPDLAPPLNPFRDAQGCLHLVATGGRSMFNMNTELRFPLYKSLSGVVFNDLGLLSDHDIRAAIKEHAVVGAVGFGLRINTVVGPLRFDIGWKVNRQQFPAGVKAERPYAWFLALGNAF